MEKIGQAVGVIAMIMSVLSFQAKTYSKIMTLQAITSTLFGTSFFFLYFGGQENALTGAFIMVSLVIRDIVFIYIRKKDGNILYATIASMIVVTVLGIVSWSGYPSLIYIIGVVINTASFAMKKPQKVRIVMMFCLPFLFAYDLINFAIGAVCSDALSMASTIIAYIRYKKQGIE